MKSRLAKETGFVTGILSSAQIILAEVKWAAGDTEAASACVYRALAVARQHDPPSEIEWLKAYGARMMVLLGDLPRAHDWLRNMQARLLEPSVFYPLGILQVARARLLLAERNAAEAAALLTKHLTGSPDMLTVEAWALLALARQMSNDGYHAHESIGRALALANQEDRLRVFFDAGAGMGRLLAKYTETHPTDSFAGRVMHLCAEQPAADIPDMLTDREIDILRLIAAGYTNDQIAQSLVLAVSTVKWYINQLYGKLSVKTRTQAVAKGRDIGVV
ncbi:MAG: LuxR C-terminal-related transcriptional regulator [Anaerolineae bacterium]